jgi:hypothetical protein
MSRLPFWGHSNFTLVKASTLLEGGEEYKEERNTYSRAYARDNGPLGNKKLRAKAHVVKRQLQRLHWDNCKVRFDEAVAFSFASSALKAGFLDAEIIAAYDRALHRNHGLATDSQDVWNNGSTVSDARRLLRQTSRRLIPANLIPRSPAKSGRACSRDPLRTNGRNQTRRPNRKRRRDGLLSNTLAHFRHCLARSCSPLMASRTVLPCRKRRTEGLQIGFPARADYRLGLTFLEAFT